MAAGASGGSWCLWWVVVPVVVKYWALEGILVAAVVVDLVATWWDGCDVDSESSGGNVLIAGDFSVTLWLFSGGLATSQAPQPYHGPTRSPLLPFSKCLCTYQTPPKRSPYSAKR